MFDAQKFLTDNNIAHATHHHHSTHGWIAIQTCPFCHSSKHHLGIHNTSGAVNCWKCGPHGLYDTIRKLLGYNHYVNVRHIIKAYGTLKTKPVPVHRVVPETALKACFLPSGTAEMLPMHRQYLNSRGFDDKELEYKYELMGVGIRASNLFSQRIIIPITHRRVMVSYQGRDVTGVTRRVRYRTCTKHDETRHHKFCLYGLDNVKGDSVVVVEGVTKVWRLGEGSVATFGIVWTMPQAELLLPFKRVFILFDRGEQAQERADSLGRLLTGVVQHVEVVQLNDTDDPGDLSENEANYLMKDLGVRR